MSLHGAPALYGEDLVMVFFPEFRGRENATATRCCGCSASGIWDALPPVLSFFHTDESGFYNLNSDAFRARWADAKVEGACRCYERGEQTLSWFLGEANFAKSWGSTRADYLIRMVKRHRDP